MLGRAEPPLPVPVSVLAGSIPASAPAAAERLRYIDALRAIAALLVVLLHTLQSFGGYGGPAMGGQALAQWALDLDLGRIGVVVFFLISGFVIPSSLRMDRPAPLAGFAIRRLWRIYPAYWLSIPASILAAWWLWGRSFGPVDALVNATLLQELVGVPAASGVYWTLLVELVFYALCMLLAWRGSLDRAAHLGVLALALLGLHVGIVFTLWLADLDGSLLALLPFHLSLMLCGALYRLRLGGQPLPAVAQGCLRALLAVYLVVFPLAAVLALGPLHNYVVSSALGVAIFHVGSCWLRVETRFTDWVGRISYSLYLFHMPVYYPLLWWVSRQPVDSPWRNQHILFYVLVSTLAALAVAALAYRWVELPGMRLGRRCAQWWQARAAARAVPREGVAAA